MINPKMLKHSPEDGQGYHQISAQRTYATMKVGDIILYSGRSIMDKLVQWKTSSPYSHIAIIFSIDFLRCEKNRILIAEAAITKKLANHNGQMPIRGVQIHCLDQWINAYNNQANIWWLPLTTHLTADSQARMQNWLTDVFKRNVGYGFRKLFQLAISNSCEYKQDSSNSSSLLCSELVVKALQIANVVDACISPAFATPKDVAQMSCFAKHALTSLNLPIQTHATSSQFNT